MLKTHLALTLVAAIYGATFTLAKEVMPEFMGPFGFIAVRVTCAFVLFLIYHRIFVKEPVAYYTDYLYFFVCAVFGVAMNTLLFFQGLSITHPVNASLIMTMSPVFVLLFATISKAEQTNGSKIGGIMLGALGAGMIIGGPRIDADAGHWLGDLLVLMNAASYAVYLVIVKPLMRRYQPMTIITWVFFFGSLLVLPFGFNEAVNARWAEMTPLVWFSVAFVTIGTTFFAYLLNAYALKRVNSSVVGAYIYLQPFMATIIAVGFGGYFLSWDQLIYSLLIFAGVYLVSRNPKQ